MVGRPRTCLGAVLCRVTLSQTLSLLGVHWMLPRLQPLALGNPEPQPWSPVSGIETHLPLFRYQRLQNGNGLYHLQFKKSF